MQRPHRIRRCIMSSESTSGASRGLQIKNGSDGKQWQTIIFNSQDAFFPSIPLHRTGIILCGEFIIPLFETDREKMIWFVDLTCHRKFFREYTSDSAEPFSDWSSELLKILSPELQARYMVAAYSKCHCASHFTPWSNQLIHRTSFASSERRWTRPRLRWTVQTLIYSWSRPFE